MADASDRWNATVERMRERLLQVTPRSAADRRAVAELLECLGALNEIHRVTVEQGAQVSAPPPAAESGPRRRRDTDPAHRYVIEQTPRGSFLAEYRGPDKQPFRVPEDAYNAAAQALADVKGPESFEQILRRLREKAGEDLADYLLRTCLRFWTSRESLLVRHTRRHYEPVRRASIVRDARRLWNELIGEEGNSTARSSTSVGRDRMA